MTKYNKLAKAKETMAELYDMLNEVEDGFDWQEDVFEHIDSYPFDKSFDEVVWDMRWVLLEMMDALGEEEMR